MIGAVEIGQAFTKDLPGAMSGSQLIQAREKGHEITYSTKGIRKRYWEFTPDITRQRTVFMRRASARVGERLISQINLVLGRDVDDASRLYFSGRYNRGILRKWPHESGHSRPGAILLGRADVSGSRFETDQFTSLLS